ncbi:dihydrodipicolinate synthase family protein [Thalassoroseus pseudoceratinae]|uniref:dihydrodipicolinate synthase family protein n=1 Tax=Thalassoroseus pseudoceratinae TaxID=2713176 RepID=UPI001423CE5F|nr:dihydrodipicolinate synthase family protein [Thalassoroseus pseudoceratinae]
MTRTELIAAAYTPMCADGALNLDSVEPMAEHCLATEVDGVFIAGSTGECHSLTLPERMALNEQWANVARGTELQVISHVGSHSQPDAIELARQSSELGLTAISAVAPSYFKPASVADLVDFMKPVAAAAEDLPFYYYHIPPMTGLTLSLPEIAQRFREEVPNYAGYKFSSTDLELLQLTQAVDPNAKVFFGTDQMLIAAWIFGVRAAVGSTYNFAAPLYRRILDACERGDLETARHEQGLSVRMVDAMRKTGFLGTSKALMKHLGVDCGPIRSPLANVDPAKMGPIIEELEAMDVLAPAFR